MKHSIAGAVALAGIVVACDSSSTSTALTRGTGSDNGTEDTAQGVDAPSGSTHVDVPKAAVDPRVVDYGEALRSASLKLVGELPSLAEIKAMGAAATDADKKTVLAATIDTYLADPRFAAAQVDFWQNTFKTEGSAAVFAAEVVVEDRAYTDLLTAKTGTCPTFEDGAFKAADCKTTASVSGVLTDPGLMAQYVSNMAFRRVRFVQETFDCTKFPAEVMPEGTPMGAGTYTSPWVFESITGGSSAKIDFQDTSSIICANCHTTMNHLAPLFANFNAAGVFTTDIQVQTPVTPAVTTTREDWLPTSESPAWRNGVQVSDLPSLGRAMAKDPAVQACAVTRMWNWGLSRGDVVNDGASVPPAVIASQVDAFVKSGFKMKPLIKAVFTSDDFVKF